MYKLSSLQVSDEAKALFRTQLEEVARLTKQLKLLYPSSDEISLEKYAWSAVTNKHSLCVRGDGRTTVITLGKPKVSEVPTVEMIDGKPSLQHSQQLNVQAGKGFLGDSTWVRRSHPDHMSGLGDVTEVEDDPFSAVPKEFFPNRGVPIDVNLKPDWNPEEHSFRTGQKVDTIYGKSKVVTSVGYFSKSMEEVIQDDRHLNVLVESGEGVIQLPYGIMTFQAGDILQIPSGTPYRVVVDSEKGPVKTINIYSNDAMQFWDGQQPFVAKMNQAPISPGDIERAEYPFSEGDKTREVYCYKEQADGSFKCFSNEQTSPFDWEAFATEGPTACKFNVTNHFCRMGGNKRHFDPNIWGILRSSTPGSTFGIAFITGVTIIKVLGPEGEITYGPAFFHRNSVHEHGRVVGGVYDARDQKSGVARVHTSGTGHGGDGVVVRHFYLRAAVAHLAQNPGEHPELQDYKAWFNGLGPSVKEDFLEQVLIHLYRDGSEYKWDKGTKLDDAMSDAIKKLVALYKQVSESGNSTSVIKPESDTVTFGLKRGIGYFLTEAPDVPQICKYGEDGFGSAKENRYGLEVKGLKAEVEAYLQSCVTQAV